jgi:Do/DeqQ family serine protease
MIKRLVIPLGWALLLVGMAAASAQERIVGPLPSLAPLVEQVSPAVVNISVTGTRQAQNPFANDPLFERFFGGELPSQPLRGVGSGVIVDAENGYLLTNHHVIENADEILVRLADDRRVEAEVIGSDANSDLAVLRIEEDSLVEIPIANNEDLRVGDYVVAIGSPLGLENTVTAGIVSALGRAGIVAGNSNDPYSQPYEDFIQTDASINVGNSGGALINLRGELVGINSAIISQTGGNIGIGLAIPTRMAVPIMEQLIEHGEVRRGLLGVRMDNVTPDYARDNNLSVTSGAIVTDVTEDSGAEAAGIQINDIIVGVNGRAVANGNELRNRIGLMRPGQQVEVDLVRGEQRMSVSATLGELTPETVTRQTPQLPEPATFEGIELVQSPQGLSVISVEPGSVAAGQGIREGDVITFINQQRVRTIGEAEAIAARSRTLTVQVQRGRRQFLVRLR